MDLLVQTEGVQVERILINTLSHSFFSEEAGLVLAGTLELIVADRAVVLYEGDSFRFESSVPHRYTNPGTTPTTVVWINSLPY